MEAARKISLYEQLEGLPDTLTGEILNGQLHTQPRPTGRHASAELGLGDALYGPFHRGRGGPGGWRIFIEPEVHFVRDVEVVVPDLAGWHRDRLPAIPEGHRFEVAPDWVCEILSPSTSSKDREIKMPMYLHYGVSYFWLIDPVAQTLRTFKAVGNSWGETGNVTGDDLVSAEPFTAISFALSSIWD